MKLLTKKLEKRFAQLGLQDHKEESVIVAARYYTPDSFWSWYAVEYDPSDRMFFGLVDGRHVELAFFSLDELEDVRGLRSFPIERDLTWQECTLAEVRTRLASRT